MHRCVLHCREGQTDPPHLPSADPAGAWQDAKHPGHSKRGQLHPVHQGEPPRSSTCHCRASAELSFICDCCDAIVFESIDQPQQLCSESVVCIGLSTEIQLVDGNSIRDCQPQLARDALHPGG